MRAKAALSFGNHRVKRQYTIKKY